MPGVTLDAGALIALEHDDRGVLVLLARAHETGARVTIPATALAQVVRAPAVRCVSPALSASRLRMSSPSAGLTRRAWAGFLLRAVPPSTHRPDLPSLSPIMWSGTVGAQGHRRRSCHAVVAYPPAPTPAELASEAR